MNKPDIIDLMDDRMNSRFEGLAQSMINLHKEHHEQLLKAVESQIKTTVNGKIDKINEKIDKQDVVLDSLKSLAEERQFITKLWFFIKFIGGIALSLGSAMLLYKNLKI